MARCPSLNYIKSFVSSNFMVVVKSTYIFHMKKTWVRDLYFEVLSTHEDTCRNTTKFKLLAYHLLRRRMLTV